VLRAAINPLPAEGGSAAGLSPPAAPDVINGRLLYNVTGDERSASLRRVDNVSGGTRPLLETLGAVTCPSGEPGGDRLAFLSDEGGKARGGNEVYVADEDGSNLRRLTDRTIERRPLNMIWNCPVWSPDASRLALIARDGIEDLLIVLPVDGSAAVRVDIDAPSLILQPVWNPDGRSVALVTSKKPRGPLHINMVDLATDPPLVTLLYETADLDAVMGLAFSPPATAGRDSPRIAFIGANYTGSGRTRLRLYSMHTNGSGLELLSELPAMEFNGWLGSPSLEWLGTRAIFFAILHRTDARTKTSLWEYDTTERQRRPLVFLEDMLYSSAWSPDGRWLAFNSDGGLYLLDWQAARRGGAVPLQISDERGYQVDWR